MIARDEAFDLLKEYNKDPFHIRHALTVEAVMKWYAKELGYEEEAEYWGIVGLLHDIDFEIYPDEHCTKCINILKDEGFDDEFINSIRSHGYGICSDIEPSKKMEQILYTVDELTGIIFAAAKMRPSKSCKDMELSSLKKKFKDKRFAAGCDREVIKNGAEKFLQVELDEVLDKTLKAMQASEDEIRSIVC